MIILDAVNTNPMIPGKGLATRLKGKTLPTIPSIEEGDFNLCCLSCEYIEKKFASTTATESYKNDKSSFLAQKLIAADTINYQLWRNGVKLADIVDDTYGDYYPSFVDAPLYVGFIVYWKKVLIAHGAATYQIKTVKNILGQQITLSSVKFRLMPYTARNANHTVRIDSYQTGNIISSEFDYSLVLSDLPDGWMRSVRIGGKFGDWEPDIEIDEYMTGTYKKEQIQTKITTTYSLYTDLLPFNISEVIIYDKILANKIIVNDYNAHNQKVYRDLSVSIKEISEVEHFKNNINSKFLIKFTDKIDNTIKTNF